MAHHESYRRNKNGYNHHDSTENSMKYQSPAFNQYGPQFAQQQAQKYQAGPGKKYSGRQHAYSVDQYNINNHKHSKYHAQNPYNQQQYNHNMKQYQQLQQQQQYIQQQRRNKQRRANSPTAYDEQSFFAENNDDDDDDNQQQQQQQQQQYQLQQYQLLQQQQQLQRQQEQQYKKNQRRQQRRSQRSKSPNNKYIDDTKHRKQRRDRQRDKKHSVPNVSSNDYMSTPKKKPYRHNSTPNGQQATERRQRRRKKRSTNTSQSGSSSTTKDSEYESSAPSGNDEGIDYKPKRKDSSTKRRAKTPNPQNIDINNGNYLGHVHEDYEDEINKVRRSNKKTRSKSPNVNNTKQRRHTTTAQRTRRNGGGGGRKKRSSKSPNPRKSAHDINSNQSSFAKLNKGRLAERFVIREKLGRGNFSVVRRVIRKVDEKEFAAKIISTKALSQQEIKDTHDEVKILGKLHHPNIVTLIDYIFTPRHLYIVLELLDGGELFERLQKKKKFNEQMAANITKQIADALAYMHSKGVVHRDLKPENILYENKSEDAKIKISDFGLSRDTKAKDARPLKTACGTPGYVAPEIIRQQAYDESVDLWAAGVIIYILLCGFPPFQGAGGVDPQQTMFRKIKSGKYSYPKPAWSKISACAMDCIDSLLCVNPKDRMTAKELLQHPWIKQAEMRNEDSFLDIHFQSNLSNYLHKKRFRRGVRLIITLNRMIRGAGLEETAREQRRKFRIRLKQYKEKLKAEKRKIYDRQQQLKLMNVTSDDYDEYEEMGYTIIDPDSTPAIDYSKV